MEIIPVVYVHNSREEMKDDNWRCVVSVIELTNKLNGSALQGIEGFSHSEIIFYFDTVCDDKVQYEARHPRNNINFPRVGIFAQRGKNRPNTLGVTKKIHPKLYLLYILIRSQIKSIYLKKDKCFLFFNNSVKQSPH
ncbi:hypothetical protein COD67_15020 [Bacillus cereus]|nr:hypothetical protein COI89_15525 [Bacillus cereus]PGU65949.1 hypothetical protein COD67_15020 [Bacillus cereus]